MRTLPQGFFIASIWFAVTPAHSEEIVINNPGGLILHELNQVGSSIGEYQANTAARIGRIQSLQKQLDDCGNCSDRTKIEHELSYWKNLNMKLITSLQIFKDRWELVQMKTFEILAILLALKERLPNTKHAKRFANNSTHIAVKS